MSCDARRNRIYKHRSHFGSMYPLRLRHRASLGFLSKLHPCDMSKSCLAVRKQPHHMSIVSASLDWPFESSDTLEASKRVTCPQRDQMCPGIVLSCCQSDQTAASVPVSLVWPFGSTDTLEGCKQVPEASKSSNHEMD